MFLLPQCSAGSSSHRRALVAVAPLPPQPELRRSGRSHHPPGEWWKVSSTRPTPEPTPEPDDAETEEEQDDDEVEEESAARVHSGQSLPFPSTLSQALKRSDHKDWKAAADLEIKAHVDNGTWEPCPLPSGRKAIGCRWVLVVKYHADGTVERHKARLVANVLASITSRPLPPLFAWPPFALSLLWLQSTTCTFVRLGSESHQVKEATKWLEQDSNLRPSYN